MVGEQIQKLAAARSKAAEEKAAMSLMQTGQKKEDQKSSQQQFFDAGKFAGIFAAIGLAIGAIGTAVASLLTGFLRLAWWQMPLALIGLVLIISGPSIIIAWFKLHQRNLGPILDANGWAINSRAKLNIPFGASLTALPKLPEGAKQSFADPYAEKPVPWKRWVALTLVLLLCVYLWRQGWVGKCFTCIPR
jgi:Ca2+/Na+ antiporter